ncbi:MAG: carbohydrate ABC transporter permease [Oscillospiraceae bacterium]|nr:carbohydrate ABC transporter permease [Oscillospiraceae bacterium]
MIENKAIGAVISQIILTLIVAVLALICLLPMWHVLMSSISDGFSLMSHTGLVLFPVGRPTIEGYSLIFRDAGVITGYTNTIIYVIGTVLLGFVLNVLGGYALSRKTKLKAFMIVFIMFPMLFGGGMIPTYMVVKSLNLVGTRFSIMLLEATMGMFIILGMRAFLSVPESTVEAARIDGAGHLQTMFRVMLPQCLGMFMVTVMMTFVAAWNSWLTAAIYVAGDRGKWPIQLWINQIIAENADIIKGANPNYDRFLIQFAVVAAATIPMLVAIPFLQKYIEAGVLTGAVKE